MPVENQQPDQSLHFKQKSPNELASQVLSVKYPDFHSNGLNDKDLNSQYSNLQDQVSLLLSKKMDNESLTRELDFLYDQAKALGVTKPTEGINANEIIKKATDKNKNFGFSDEESRKAALNELGKKGYIRAYIEWRRDHERSVLSNFAVFTDSILMESQLESETLKNLENKTFRLDSLTPEQLMRLEQEFPDGNFLYHGAKTESVIKILESGELLNFKAISDRQEQLSPEEKRGSIVSNSGSEGISWSFNDIHALPGDRFHLAGFLASPNRVLKENQQFCIPSRPAPYELIQINGNIDANEFYLAKTQSELIDDFDMQEKNSVRSNLSVLSRFKEKQNGVDSYLESSMLLNFIDQNTDDQIENLTKGKFSIRKDGTIEFSQDLLQQQNDEIPLAAVWGKALIESGRIRNIPGFEDINSVRDFINRIDKSNSSLLFNELFKEKKHIKTILDREEDKVEDLSDDIEDLFLVVSDKDYSRYMRVIARCKKQPRGILVYQASTVRLENFASEHTGDHESLVKELRKGIQKKEKSEGFIDWEDDIYDQKLQPEHMTGYRSHVVSEKYIPQRKSLRKDAEGNMFISA